MHDRLIVATALLRARQGASVALLTCVDKANVLRSFAFFRQVFEEVAAGYPEIATQHLYVDATAARMVTAPETLDVLVTENMFGDILSDLGAGLIGGMGMAPSADLGDRHAIFQPSHGTAPDIAGQGIANPLATILSAAMMLAWLARRHNDPALAEGARRIEAAVASALAAGEAATVGLGGRRGTAEVGDAVAALVADLRESRSGEDAPVQSVAHRWRLPSDQRPGWHRISLRHASRVPCRVRISGRGL